MSPAVAQIQEEAERLVPPAIKYAHISQVRRRVAEVESGQVALIPGEEALAQVRRLLSSAE